jgi:hypothetical protein
MSDNIDDDDDDDGDDDNSLTLFLELQSMWLALTR